MTIRCEGLAAAYGKKTIFENLTISFQENAVNTIIGPSGSGKSTLLRLFAALEDPQEGTIFYDDEPHYKLHPRDIRDKVGMIFQKPTLFEGTVFDNLAFGLKLKKEEINRDRIENILNQVDIPVDYLEKQGNELSVGEQQRICIVRSLLLDPLIILLDEPVSALDPQRAKRVLRLIKSLKTDFQKTVIMVSHNMNDALTVSDKIFFMSDDRIVIEGNPQDIRESSNIDIRSFMAGDYE